MRAQAACGLEALGVVKFCIRCGYVAKGFFDKDPGHSAPPTMELRASFRTIPNSSAHACFPPRGEQRANETSLDALEIVMERVGRCLRAY
jgi:hypothetical protein